MPDFAPELSYAPLIAAAPRLLSLENQPETPFPVWRDALGSRLREVLGTEPIAGAPQVRVEWNEQRSGFTETRFVFASEAHVDVPCHLLVPDAASSEGVLPPVVLCLQGHTSGMHLSLGRAQTEADQAAIAGDRDFALQAVRRGYAALVLEQRCFGERAPRSDAYTSSGRCQHSAMVALLLGRTLNGGRVWDVQRAVDVLETVFADVVDTGRIGCMGNSNGGTVAYYAACLDARIQAVLPSCAVCTYGASIGDIHHCADNYLPGALRWFDMPDLAALIAPRPLLLIAGRNDDIFPLPGVEAAFATIQQIYARAGAPSDRCRLVVGEGGHRFYADLAWDAFGAMTGWVQPDVS